MTYNSNQTKFFGADLRDSDIPRLKTQAEQVFAILAGEYNQKWVTIEQLQKAIESRYLKRWPQPSLSAVVRALRNQGYAVETKRREGGIAEYRLEGYEPTKKPISKKSDRNQLVKLVKELANYIDETGNNNLFLSTKLENAGLLEMFNEITL